RSAGSCCGCTRRRWPISRRRIPIRTPASPGARPASPTANTWSTRCFTSPITRDRCTRCGTFWGRRRRIIEVWPSAAVNGRNSASPLLSEELMSMVDTGVQANGPARGLGPVLQRLRERKEWKLPGVVAQADRALAGTWWLVLVLRGVLPAVFGIAMGLLVGAVQHGAGLAVPLTFTAVVFILLQILPPIHQAISANLGDRTAAWLYDQLTGACVHPPGIGHLEDPRLTGDLTVARDFDLGITGPPLSLSMDFIASGLVEMIPGLACAAVLAGYRWWAPPVLAGAWLATHWLLRESAVWRDRNTDEVRATQRDSDYAYRLAVDPPA